jgi:putative ABC transport system permease protein
MRRLTAWRMLLHDRSSTAGALLGVVAIVFLVGQQLSIFFGLLNYMSVLVDHSGADVWILSSNTSNVDAANLLPGRYVDRTIGLPQVEWAEPILFGNGSFKKSDGSFESVRVIGLRRPRLAAGPWAFAQADNRTVLDLEAVTVDRLDLEILGNPELNTITEIGNFRAKIAAVTEGARGFQGTLVFSNLDKVKEISKTPSGRYSAILVKFRETTVIEEGVQLLRALLPRCSVYSSSQLSAMTRSYYISNTGIGGSFGFSTVIAVLIGMVIITLMMYTSALNRERDFAVMRALGARKWDISVLVISQALMISFIGIIVGFFLLAMLFNAIRGAAIPSYYPKSIPPLHATITVLVSLFGSLFALRRALKAEPASVFH